MFFFSFKFTEEEIDVVSVGDKTLPTNPSAKDRRALQTTVAHKISAGIVKTTSTGIRTIPSRRRNSDDSETSCTATPTKSSSYSSGCLSSTSSTSSLQLDSSNNSLSTSRKRQRDEHHQHRSNGGSNNAKRFRGKKQRSPIKRQTSDTDENDTIEKRNLHNDMERQRRIGLKNLFEELKYQIPSLKDKERAPKVSILREAAALCRRYIREEEERNALKKQQTKLYNRVSVLRTSLAAQRSRCLE